MTHDEKVEKLTEIAIETYRNMYNDGLGDEDILEMNPTTYESDANAFYEALSFKIGLHDDDFIYPDDEEGETVEETVERMAEHWDGDDASSSPYEGYMNGEYDDDSPTVEDEQASLNDGDGFDPFEGVSTGGGGDDDFDLLAGLGDFDDFDEDF